MKLLTLLLCSSDIFLLFQWIKVGCLILLVIWSLQWAAVLYEQYKFSFVDRLNLCSWLLDILDRLVLWWTKKWREDRSKLVDHWTLELLVPWWIKKWREVHSKAVGCWILYLLVLKMDQEVAVHSISMAVLLWYIHLCSGYHHKCTPMDQEVAMLS